MIMSRIIGHRGCAGHAPENTCAGIRDAARVGVNWIEADVALLDDGTVVLFHDDTLDRCTNLSGFVHEKNWTEILQADVGLWFDDGRFVGERVPLLSDAIICAKALGLGFNIELKTHRGEGDALANAVAETILKSDHGDLLVSSYDAVALTSFRTCAPNLPIGVIYDELPKKWENSFDAKSVHLWQKNLTQKSLDHLKALGCDVYAFSVNDKAEAERLWGMGVDGVFSDFPDRLL